MTQIKPPNGQPCPGLMDSHVHLGALRRPQHTLRKAQSQGLGHVLLVSQSVAEHRVLTGVRRAWKGHVILSLGLGLHPETKPPSPWDFEKWLAYFETHQQAIDVIGEVGVPWYSHPGKRDLFRWLRLLERIAGVASQSRRAMVLHAVHDMALPAFEVIQGITVPVVFHWLKAPEAVVDTILEAGHYVSVTPEVCWRKRDQELLARIPPCQLLVETDAPWPHDPSQGASSPGDVQEVYTYLATTYPNRDWNKQIAENLRRFLQK